MLPAHFVLTDTHFQLARPVKMAEIRAISIYSDHFQGHATDKTG